MKTRLFRRDSLLLLSICCTTHFFLSTSISRSGNLWTGSMSTWKTLTSIDCERDGARRAICWFKPTAHEYLSRAWQVAAILERNDVFIRMIKIERVGRVFYEDEAQVLAEPSFGIRRFLERR